MSGVNGLIASVFVSLGLDYAQYEAGLKKAGDAGKGLGKTLGLGLAGAVATVTAAAVATGVAVKAAIDQADQLDELSQKLGVSVEALSGLKYAAEISGVSLESLSGGLRKLAVGLDDAATGNGGKAADALERLGLSATTAGGALKSSDQVLVEVAGKFAGMQDGATKTALAIDLFGKSGAELIPLLNEGADGIGELLAEADALGITLSGEVAAAAGQFNENLDKMKAVGQGITNQVAAGLAPTLADLSGVLLTAAKDTLFMEAVTNTLSIALKGLVSAGVIVGAVFKSVYNAVKTVAGAVMQVVKGDFAGAFKTLEAGQMASLKNLQDSGRQLAAVWTGSGQAIQRKAPKLADEIASPIVGGAGKARAAAREIDKAAKEAAKAQADAAEYIARVEEDLATRGMSSEQQKARDLRAKASDLIAQGFLYEAAAALRLADRYDQLADAAKATVKPVEDLANALPNLEAATDGWASVTRGKIEDVQDAFMAVRSGVDDLFYGIRDNDWVSAFAGLYRAIEQVKVAFDSAASSGSKMQAVAAVGSAVGGAIGGKAGSALSGAAGGFAAGNMILPGIGGIVGGVLGGLGGLFGSNKAKKRAKAQAKAEAERRAAELAAAKRGLEIELMRLSGDEAGALAAAREQELKGMDASLQALQKEIWAKQDAAEAEAKAAELVAARTALEIELQRLQGDDAGAVARERALALAELDASLRPLQQAIYDVVDANAAREASEQALADATAAWAAEQDRVASATEAARAQVREALARDVDALEDTAERFGGVADDLKALNDDLRRGQLAASPAGSLDAARAAFQKVAARVAAGDTGALDLLGQASQDFADASTRGARSAEENARNQAQIRKSLVAGEALARSQVSAAQQQIAAMQALYAPLVGVEAGVLSLNEAVDALAAAVIEQHTINRQAAAALGALQSSLDAAMATPAAANLNAASAADLTPIDPAAVSAGVSAQLTASSVDVTSPGSTADLAGVGEKLDRLLVATETGVLTDVKVLSLFRRWDGDGMPDVRDVA